MSSRKSDFIVFYLEKFGAPSGHLFGFFVPSAIFSTNGAKARPGQNPVNVLKNLSALGCLYGNRLSILTVSNQKLSNSVCL